MSQETWDLKESKLVCLTGSYTANVVRRDSEASQTERNCMSERHKSKKSVALLC